MSSLLIVIKLLFISSILISCNKGKFIKTTLFIEEFNDNSKGWYSKPDSNILSSSSGCIKIEDGQLKMHFERGLGISNCGGGWLELELSDSALNKVEYFDKIGIKVKLSNGFFQHVNKIDSISGPNTYSHTLKYSKLRFYCGGHRIDFPSKVLVDSLLPDENKFQGSEFVLLSFPNGSMNKLYINSEEVNYYWDLLYSSVNQYDFKMSFIIGYGQELVPHEIDLFIESIEIFTWDGEFCIDKI
ncbi:MAG: hypothetical protein R2799_14590 [Crocinitomicaceae bacterium]